MARMGAEVVARAGTGGAVRAFSKTRSDGAMLLFVRLKHGAEFGNGLFVDVHISTHLSKEFDVITDVKREYSNVYERRSTIKLNDVAHCGIPCIASTVITEQPWFSRRLTDESLAKTVHLELLLKRSLM